MPVAVVDVGNVRVFVRQPRVAVGMRVRLAGRVAWQLLVLVVFVVYVYVLVQHRRAADDQRPRAAAHRRGAPAHLL